MYSVSIIIPIFNEEKTIIKLLKLIQRKIVNLNNFNFEIIIIDDCSTDSTKSLLEKTRIYIIFIIQIQKTQEKDFA